MFTVIASAAKQSRKASLAMTLLISIIITTHAQNPVTAPEVRIPGKAQNKVKRIQQPMTGVLFYRLSDSTMCVRNPDNSVTPLSGGSVGDYSPWDTTATGIIQKDTTLNACIGTTTPFAKLTTWGNGFIGWGDFDTYTDYRFLQVDTDFISIGIRDSTSSYSVYISRTNGMSINHTFPNGTKNYLSMENDVIRLGSDNGDELAADYFDNHVQLDTLGNISIYTMTAGDVVRANITLDTFGTVLIDTATNIRFRPLATGGAAQFVTVDSVGTLGKSSGGGGGWLQLNDSTVSFINGDTFSVVQTGAVSVIYSKIPILVGDPDANIIAVEQNDDGFQYYQGATRIMQCDDDNTPGNTKFLLYDVDNGTLERVSVGAADSGGAGFKVLRIPN